MVDDGGITAARAQRGVVPGKAAHTSSMASQGTNLLAAASIPDLHSGGCSAYSNVLAICGPADACDMVILLTAGCELSNGASAGVPEEDGRAQSNCYLQPGTQSCLAAGLRRARKWLRTKTTTNMCKIGIKTLALYLSLQVADHCLTFHSTDMQQGHSRISWNAYSGNMKAFLVHNVHTWFVLDQSTRFR